MTELDKVLVVGSGAMGSQIAMVCALGGLTVSVYDLDPGMLDKARTELGARMDRNVAKGRMTAQERDEAFDRLSFGTDLAVAAAGADFVIEAAVEKLDVKRELFAELDRLCPEHTILATNSSSFVPSKIADATSRPSLVCNMHFFNPALVMKCVEIVPGPATADETIAATVALTRRIGKLPVVLDKEIPGFVANRILNAVRDEAIRLFEGGYASVESIDTACRTALGYPMGPFELMDLTGIDIGYFTKVARMEETGRPQDGPSKSVTELVDAGRLGRKTRRGWYEYDDNGNRIEGLTWTSH